ncbi:hypothetical protein BRADI_1g56704v3 [Brachypodium distachyon]|uniref:Uncharacterized protein n=1 Tax=Brachypodium distachyon TaxID=15368 RepID=A0A2K2DRT9_BRADI|nr:hypothetical protein BRADI_1g56704v3 [Brachypodium distachyon]
MRKRVCNVYGSAWYCCSGEYGTSPSSWTTSSHLHRPRPAPQKAAAATVAFLQPFDMPPRTMALGHGTTTRSNNRPRQCRDGGEVATTALAGM